ncbi:MAG TPA: M23 family metallopeptidase [Polyangia bacterium]|nr:M23 family metallopeptidase [Polyangia bacterium]
MARVVSALPVAVLLLLCGAAQARNRLWEDRRPPVEPVPAHQLRDMATWPAEPPSPAPVDESRFRESFAYLCGVAADSATAAFAGDILTNAAEVAVDPFLLASLVLYQSNCKPALESKAGTGLLRISRSMYLSPGAPVPPVAPGDLSVARLLDPHNNLRVGARLLKMWQDVHPELDRLFGGVPHRSAVSHFVWGDEVHSSGHEDLILTARRRLLRHYEDRVDVPRESTLGVPIVAPLEGIPRVASSGPGEDREGGARRHRGLDITATLGEPVRAIADGTVIFAGVNLSGRPRTVVPPEKIAKWVHRRLGVGGIYVCINHDEQRKVVSCYMHLSSFSVANDEHVTAGQRIGSVGRTGVKVSPPHLHFEIRVSDRYTNPARYLTDMVIPPKATMTYRYMLKAKRSKLRATRSAIDTAKGV